MRNDTRLVLKEIRTGFVTMGVKHFRAAALETLQNARSVLIDVLFGKALLLILVALL